MVCRISSGVSDGRQVCQKAIRSVSRSPDVSKDCKVYQIVVRCVRRMSDVSEGREVCNLAISCVSRSPSVSKYCKVCHNVFR